MVGPPLVTLGPAAGDAGWFAWAAAFAVFAVLAQALPARSRVPKGRTVPP
ncbi:hypothetical protein [Jidongwangia harbinensis]|nr:hypothetical protein [Jidongwangia harbinensis]MCA2217363.1 hypothetical protein [Jidongwangia harbinensis]